MPPAVIRLENIVQHYAGNLQPVLDHINIEIYRGEFTAVMGPSGSGKSTLMNILGCLDVPSSGHYFLDGQDVTNLPPDQLAATRNQQIGFVFQGFNLLQRMTAVDNVALPLLYCGVSAAERTHRALRMLEQVGLAACATRRPNAMSGGQQQRVAVARALINHPSLLLADEPTGNLDTHTSHEIMQLFRTLNENVGITVILVTHEHDVAAYARRLIRLVDGRVVHDGAVTEQFRAAQPSL